MSLNRTTSTISDTESLHAVDLPNTVFPRPWENLPIYLPPSPNLQPFDELSLVKKLQIEYWWVGNPKVFVGPDPNSNLKIKWLPFATRSRQAENRIELTEYQVVRECLWALIGAVKSVLFVSYTSDEILTKNLCLYTRKPACLTHLTYGALDAFCTEIAECATCVLQLKAFVNFVLLSGCPTPSPFSHLAQTCERLRQDAFSVISDLEQEAKGLSRLTIISLSTKWRAWFRRFSFMSALILQVCSPQLNTILCGETSILLLNRLEELSRTIPNTFPDPYLVSLIGETFVSATETYLSSIMSGSNFKNIPFLRYNDNVPPTHPQFWHSGITLIESSVPNVLSPIIHDVFIGAKAFSLLKVISSVFRNQQLLNIIESRPKFFSHLSKDVNSKDDINSKPRELEEYDDPDIQDMVKFMESAILNKSKHVLLYSPFRKKTFPPEKTVQCLREEVRRQALKITFYLVSYLLRGPLAPPGTWLSAISCLADDLNLIHAFDSLAGIAFFRSGEGMYTFCEEVFSLQLWNRTESLLNKALRDQVSAICREKSWLCDRLHLNLGEHSDSRLTFHDLTLKINIPWPLTVIISEESLTIYQKVFKFLFTLKHAKWILDNAKWTFETGNHKLLLLRSRCLYVINGLHAFIVDHIETAHLEFTSSVTKPDSDTCLDDLLKYFGAYLNRVNEICLLSESVSQKMINQTLRELFGLCTKLQFPSTVCVEHLSSEFSTRVSFLRTVLKEALQGSGLVRMEANLLLKMLDNSCQFNTGVKTRLHI